MFTWKKGNNLSTLIRERLDRVVASSLWVSSFSNVDVRFFSILVLHKIEMRKNNFPFLIRDVIH